MFNKDELKILFCGVVIGAEIGVGLCALLFFYDLFAETWNCFCGFFGSSGGVSEVKSWNTFLYVFLVCLIIGFAIGIFGAISTRSERVEKEKDIRNRKNYKEVVKEINNVLKVSEKDYWQIREFVGIVPWHKVRLKSEIDELLKLHEQQKNKLQGVEERYKT